MTDSPDKAGESKKNDREVTVEGILNSDTYATASALKKGAAK